MHPKNSAIVDSPITGTQITGQALSAPAWLLITQAFLISLIALFCPLPVLAIDVLLMAGLALCGVFIFLILFGAEPAKIAFIPVWVEALTLLRLAAGIAAVRSAVLNADAGRIVAAVSAKIYFGILSTLAALILIALLCIIICAAAVFIYRKAAVYLSKTIPVRRAALDAEYAAGIITHIQMLRAAARVKRQALFFSRASAASGLLVCEALMQAIVLCALLAFSLVKPAAAQPGAAVAIAAIIYVPGFLLAISLAVLLNKRFLINLKVKTTLKDTSLVDKTETGTQQAVGSLAGMDQSLQEQNSLSQSGWQSAAGFELDIAKDTPAAQTAVDSRAPALRDDYYYDSILATIGDRKRATVLLAGQTAADLPVTVAVELVIRIIAMKKRCLLMDTDALRNAVSAAFDIDINSMQQKAVPTGIDYLWICPADRPDMTAPAALSRKVVNALKVFHYIVIYAPNAAQKEIAKELAGIADVAVIFGNENSSDLKELTKELSQAGCRAIPERDFAASTE